MISPKSWAVALWLSRSLCQADREPVLGDLTESGESGGGAIADILGLVVRRWTTGLFDIAGVVRCRISHSANQLSAFRYCAEYGGHWCGLFVDVPEQLGLGTDQESRVLACAPRNGDLLRYCLSRPCLLVLERRIPDRSSPKCDSSG